MSEAQQYQLIRKYWKDQYRKAQREQSILAWEHENKAPHPLRVKAYRDLGFRTLPLISRESERQADKHRLNASEYAWLLDKFKVRKKKKKSVTESIVDISYGFNVNEIDKCEAIAVKEVLEKDSWIYKIIKFFRWH